MGFKLSVDGSINLDVQVIKTVEFISATPKDTDARTTDLAVTLKVTGKILSLIDGGSEDSVQLALWAMIPAEQSDCYKNVTVTVTAAGQVVREYTLPNAFVVDYTETYDDSEGVGTFELIVRQKKDKIQTTQINGGYGA